MFAVVRLLRAMADLGDESTAIAADDDDEQGASAPSFSVHHFQEDGAAGSEIDVMMDNIASGSRAATWRRYADEINGRPLPPGLYHALLSRAEGDHSAASQARKQIEKDVHRTFGSVRGLRVPQKEALQSLRNVLLAYAEHNPQVSYCQSSSVTGIAPPKTTGLRASAHSRSHLRVRRAVPRAAPAVNFLAAVLLLVVDEESAFWILAAIVERLMPGHFSDEMAMALVDQGVFADFLRAEDARLVDHLEFLQVAPSLVTTQVRPPPPPCARRRRRARPTREEGGERGS